jgi:Ser-tRNA(Ala) deacylase AlaX
MSGGEITVQVVEYDRVAELCGGVCPEYLPKGKEARIVSILGLGCPCAGTHVKDISELEAVTVTKITYKKGVVRVSYKC